MDRTSAPQPDQDTRSLADTGSSGIDRLRELEKLLNTARRVRKLAEGEIAQGKNLERAQQRFDAANRMQRKVERELLRLRSELANEYPEVNQVWSPGDPVGRKPASHPPRPPADEPVAPQPGDFELSVMLGKDKARWNQPGTTRFALDRDSSSNPPPTAREPRPKPAPAANRAAPKSTGSPKITPRSTSPSVPTRRQGRGRSWLVGALVVTGILAGGGLTVVLTDQPAGLSRVQNYWDQARAWLGTSAESSEAVTSPAPKPISTPAPAPAATPTPAQATGTVRRTRPTASQIMAEERRLQREARQRFETRLKQLRAANKSAALF